MYTVNRGLGATYKIGSDGTAIDCDQWSNVFESVCWVPDWLGGKSQQALPAKAITTTEPVTGSPVTTYEPILPADIPGGDTPGPLGMAMNWGLIAIVLGVGVFAVVAAGSGTPRRYGR